MALSSRKKMDPPPPAEGAREYRRGLTPGVALGLMGSGWVVLLCGIMALTLSISGCKVSVNDFEKWRNRPGSEELFVEWMLEPEATPEVRAKAIEMLFEQYNQEGSDYLPRIADLPGAARDQAILDAVPHITDLYEGAEFPLGGDALFSLDPTNVRDGVLQLLSTSQTPAVQDALMGLVVRWLEDHYDPCLLSVGRHPTQRVLSTAGHVAGLPIVIRAIEDSDPRLMTCFSHPRNSGNITWLSQVKEQIAAAYVRRWVAHTPSELDDQLRVMEIMLAVEESETLKDWIFQQHLTNADSLLMASPAAVVQFFEYVRGLAAVEDAPHYVSVITQREGSARWIAFWNLVDLAGAQGLADALDAIPDAGIWGLVGGQNLPDGLSRATVFICGSDGPIGSIADDARPVLTQRLESANLVTRAVAIQCLSEIGDAETIERLTALQQSQAVIPAWSEEETTVAALASEAIERLQNPRANEEDGTATPDDQ